MATFNLHSLFRSTVYDDTYLAKLTLEEDDRAQMQSARTRIRDRLRTRLPGVLQKELQTDERVRAPRFFTQGSWAYKTLNAPCRTPQQADLDDGTYLPFSYLEQEPPSVVSTALFNSVEKVLRELADETEGWTLFDDNPNCTRIEIAPDKHIDVPVYSIPDDEFEKLREARNFLLKAGMDSLAADQKPEDDNWDLMPTHGVLMATKNRGWRDNDPRPVKDWVNDEIAVKSEQLRHIMRYLKGWRDHQTWAKGDPKSILLMVAAAEAYDTQIHARDDLALLAVVSKLPEILSGQLINPTTINKPDGEQEDLAKRLDEDGIREEVIQRFKNLALKIKQAIQGSSSPQESCNLLISEFGARLPNDATRVVVETVKTDSPDRTPAILPVGNRTSA
ncbi:CBASS cGAMP synthase [Pseudomonas sp. LARHCG127]